MIEQDLKHIFIVKHDDHDLDNKMFSIHIFETTYILVS